MLGNLVSALLAKFRRAGPDVAHASAYRVGARVVICTDSLTRDGFYVCDGPPLRPDPEDVEDLGRAVLSALAASRSNVRTPTRDENIFQPILDAAGVGPRKFAQLARLVSIEATEGGVRFLPARNLGSKEGFHGRPELAFETPSRQASVVGDALRKAFELAS
jgi:hypothetical protein